MSLPVPIMGWLLFIGVSYGVGWKAPVGVAVEQVAQNFSRK